MTSACIDNAPKRRTLVGRPIAVIIIGIVKAIPRSKKEGRYAKHSGKYHQHQGRIHKA
jgi:hypothetical protein